MQALRNRFRNNKDTNHQPSLKIQTMNQNYKTSTKTTSTLSKTITLSVLLSAPLMLMGCDIFSSKEPLPGKREVIFAADSAIKPEVIQGIATVSIPKGETNKDWAIPGGKLSNTLPPLTLNDTTSKTWSTSIGSGNNSEKRFTSNAIIQHDVIYAMDTHGIVSAISFSDGTKLWSMPTAPSGRDSDTLGGGIAAAGDFIYATTSFGHVLALEAKSGKQVWDRDLTNPIRIAPTISDGKIFVINIANETHALDAKTGSPVWSHAGLPESTGILGGAVPPIDSGLILAPYSSGEIYALDVQTGQPKWSETLTPTISSDSLSSISHIRARPLIHQGTVYAISHGGRMVALDLITGQRKWQREFAGIRTPALYGDYLYFVSIDGDLTCINRHDAKVIWSVRLKSTTSDKSKISWAGPIIAGGNLVLTGSNGQIIHYSPKDGKRVNVIDTGDSFSLSPIVVNGSLITLSDSATLTHWR